jgi:hypothetical protein
VHYSQGYIGNEVPFGTQPYSNFDHKEELIWPCKIVLRLAGNMNIHMVDRGCIYPFFSASHRITLFKEHIVTSLHGLPVFIHSSAPAHCFCFLFCYGQVSSTQLKVCLCLFTILNKNINAICKVLVPCFIRWNKIFQTFFILTKRWFLSSVVHNCLHPF